MSCDAERLYLSIEPLIKKLSDGAVLVVEEDKRLRELLDEYWDIECPSEAEACRANSCIYAVPYSWIEYHGYISMNDLLGHFDYENMKVLELKNKNSVDMLGAKWARRPGHYNP
ncbi:hypothetical protein R1U54_001361 [Vibrio fluvialis]|nr:hypothetical protein [Vibrio fluvialis]EKO3534832.1 hypothetical protein [Vibrio fluvialis]ELP2651272.1 hypothetical protein [Vibrio fluvialis]